MYGIINPHNYLQSADIVIISVFISCFVSAYCFVDWCIWQIMGCTEYLGSVYIIYSIHNFLLPSRLYFWKVGPTHVD